MHTGFGISLLLLGTHVFFFLKNTPTHWLCFIQSTDYTEHTFSRWCDQSRVACLGDKIR